VIWPDREKEREVKEKIGRVPENEGIRYAKGGRNEKRKV